MSTSDIWALLISGGVGGFMLGSFLFSVSYFMSIISKKKKSKRNRKQDLYEYSNVCTQNNVEE